MELPSIFASWKVKKPGPGLSFLLLLIAFSAGFSTAAAQDIEDVLVYSQDFESVPFPEWALEPGWDVINEDTSVLTGSGHTWARLDAGPFSDMRLLFRIQTTPESNVHINVHVSGRTRYFIGMNRDILYLSKQIGEGVFLEDLATAPGLISGWQQVEIQLDGPRITVDVNGQERITYVDPDPLDTGWIALESLTNSSIMIDDIEIWVPETEEMQGLHSETSWVRTGGPLGGLGYDVRMRPDNPDIMYVTDGWAGVFMSTDGGQTWSPSNNGIATRKGESRDSIPVFCLTIDPHDHDIIWVGTEHSARIYKSTDAGASWTDMTSNIRDEFFDGLTFRGFTVHPENSDIVYTAAELHSWAQNREPVQGREFEMVEGIVYRTTDGGERWEEVWRGESLARYVWINPEDPDVMYLSTGIFDREAANSNPDTGYPGGEGVLKSIDGGQTWQHANDGLGNLYVGSLFMHPENPDILLAGTGNNQYFQENGVYITQNGAKTWQLVLSDQNIESVEFNEVDPSIAYAGSDQAVIRSDDGGFTWTKISGQDWGPEGVRVGFPIDFQVDPRDPDRLFANAYGGGNFVSEDGGRTWTASSKGYTGAQVRAVAVHPEQPGTVYAAARSGLFVSTNGGRDWIGVSYPPVKVMEWNAVALNPADPSHIAAGNNWNTDLVVSYDRGTTWTLTNSRIVNGPNGISTIAFAPSEPETLYAAAAGFYSAGSFDPFIEATGIHVSHDGGQTWQPANSGLTVNAGVADLAVHPEDPGRVYAASTTHGLLRTTDGGSSWTQLQGLPDQGCSAVAFHLEAPDFLLAGFERGGIYASPDDGETWQRASSGMPPEATIKSIVFDPSNPEIVYAADIQSGVYRSLDRGQTWGVINDGLRTRAVNDLALSSDGLHLYAATEGEGVYRLDLNGEPPEEGELFAGPDPDASPGEDVSETEPEATGTPQQPAAPAETEEPGRQGPCSSIALLPLALGWVLMYQKPGNRKG